MPRNERLKVTEIEGKTKGKRGTTTKKMGGKMKPNAKAKLMESDQKGEEKSSKTKENSTAS